MRIPRNEEYLAYAAEARDEALLGYWSFYEAVKAGNQIFNKEWRNGQERREAWLPERDVEEAMRIAGQNRPEHPPAVVLSVKRLPWTCRKASHQSGHQEAPAEQTTGRHEAGRCQFRRGLNDAGRRNDDARHRSHGNLNSRRRPPQRRTPGPSREPTARIWQSVPSSSSKAYPSSTFGCRVYNTPILGLQTSLGFHWGFSDRIKSRALSPRRYSARPTNPSTRYFDRNPLVLR